MNIQFTIVAFGFEKAAAIEKALKELGVSYFTTISKTKDSNKPKRAKLDKIQLAVILACIDKHPKWSDKEVSRSTGIGDNTVNRVRRGVHPIQKDDGKDKPLKAVKK